MLFKKAKNSQKKSYGNDFSNLLRSFIKVRQVTLIAPTDVLGKNVYKTLELC